MGNRVSAFLMGIVALLLIVPATASATPAVFNVFTDAGPDPASILDTVTLFRTALGDPNNANAPGPLATGRREINWDGGGTATTVSPTPFNGFQNIRGALFTTAGTGFVQAPPSGLATQFSNITYETTFQPFSPPRVFTPIGSNVTDVTFFIPGTSGATPATVAAFGAVFSDVDLMNITSIEYFRSTGESLGRFFAPQADGGLSFLGVLALDEQISRVRIITGNAALGPGVIDGVVDTPNVDVVVMDDFLYAEPKAAAGVPEPGSLLLLGAGLAGLWLQSRRRPSPI